MLAESPYLARRSLSVGASRAETTTCYFEEIKHHIYSGDAAFHVAAAAYECSLARELLAGERALVPETGVVRSPCITRPTESRARRRGIPSRLLKVPPPIPPKRPINDLSRR